MDELKICSYAKINIGLYVLDRLIDGYHEIITLFQQISLYDTLKFIKSKKGIKIITDDPQMPRGEENLVWKAFNLFKDKADVKGGLDVYLEKKIPMGAGLAGGSSNAAVTLMAANKLWGNLLHKSELLEMANQLGADVPFFIFSASAIGRGKGEILEKVNYDKNWWIVLVCPAVSISTKWVYSQTKFILTKIKKITNFKTLFENFDCNDLQGNLYNELEEIVFKRYPFLEKIKNQLKEMGAFYVSMSGSGSSMYGLFKGKKQATKAKEFFSMEKEIDAFLCRPLDTFPYSSLLM
ncbi:MAG: 4-(cytidine 5'-diphospho)-2-C-methyl-D-erythritol kinase [bacterium]